jgi:hypothetical protein
VKSFLSLLAFVSVGTAAAATFDVPEPLALFHSIAIERSLGVHRGHIANLKTVLDAKPADPADAKLEEKIVKETLAELLSPIETVKVSDVKVADFSDKPSDVWAVYSGKVAIEFQSKQSYLCDALFKFVQNAKTLEWTMVKTPDNLKCQAK